MQKLPSFKALTIYAPVNLTAPCIMVFMRASPLPGGLGPGTRYICGPLEIARAVRRVPFVPGV